MRGARGWAVLAAVALAVAVGVLLAPLGTSESCIATVDGSTACTQARTSLLAHEGGSVILPLSLPLLACLLPLVVRRRLADGLVAAALLLFCAVTGFTIGVFFLPVAVGALVLAVRAPARATTAPPTSGGPTP